MTSPIRVLFNDCYGDFAFSEAFEAEYLKRAGHAVEADGRLYRIGSNSIRCDPVALAIYDEFGSEWCSGQEAELAIRDVPAIFASYWEIDDYGGNETVRLRIDEAMADILETFIQTGDEAALRRQHAALSEAAGLTKKTCEETSKETCEETSKEPSETFKELCETVCNDTRPNDQDKINALAFDSGC